MATSGNNKLGGDDFDEILVNYVADNCRENGVDLRKDKMAHQRLKEATEKQRRNYRVHNNKHKLTIHNSNSRWALH